VTGKIRRGFGKIVQEFFVDGRDFMAKMLARFRKPIYQ